MVWCDCGFLDGPGLFGVLRGLGVVGVVGVVGCPVDFMVVCHLLDKPLMLQIVLQGWAPGLGGVDMTQSDLDLKMTLVSPSPQFLGGLLMH